MSTSRQIAVTMFTDIVGYTTMMGRNQKLALKVIKQNKELQSRLIKQFRGTLLKEMGDGILVSFRNVSDAVFCAGAILKEVLDLKDLNLRIGIHMGEVVSEGNEIYGDGVNIASRIEEIADKGTLFVSETVYDNIKNRPEIACTYLGEQSLKNVDKSIKLYSVSVTEIPDEYAKTKFSFYPKMKSIIKVIGVLSLLALAYWLIKNNTAENLNTQNKEKSLAVLPFVDMSPQQDQAYLGDGLAEELITKLAPVEDLKVIARTSSFRFRGETLDVREIGDALDVSHVLEGSVRKSGDRLRITAQLIDAKTNDHIWASNFDRAFGDIFLIQDDIAQQISQILKLSLGIPISENGKSLVDPTAYENFLKGKYFTEQLVMSGDETNFNKAEKMFDLSLQMDSTLADSYAGLGYLYLHPDRMQESKDLIIQGFKINPNSDYINNCLGVWYQFDGALDLAHKYVSRAVEINPKNAIALRDLGTIQFHLGLYDQSEYLYEKALEYDPINVHVLWDVACYYTASGRLEKGIELCEEGLHLDDDFLAMIYYLVNIYSTKRDTNKVIEYFDRIKEVRNDSIIPPYLMALYNSARGRLDLVQTDMLYGKPLVLLGMWDEWIKQRKAKLSTDPYDCIYPFLNNLFEGNTNSLDPNILNLYSPMIDHPEFESLLELEKERYDQNLERYSIRF